MFETKGDTYLDGKSDSIRNGDGTWINTHAFREAGEHFKKYDYYIADPWDSPAWTEYWFEEREKCIQGYSVGDAQITGDHYFYLNYSPIQKVEGMMGLEEISADKIEGFPDFWDGDYNYYWIREIARRGVLRAVIKNGDEAKMVLGFPDEQKALYIKQLYESLNLEVEIEPDYYNGGYNLIIGKSRRKGYSYKGASIGAKNYYTIPKSLTIFGAYDKKYLYPKGIFSMALDNINFINRRTAWVFPTDVTDKAASGHIKGSYMERVNGVDIEMGFMSEIMAPSFQDNPDAARGKGAHDVFIEEAGAFGSPGLLKKSYKSTIDAGTAGAYKTGMVTVFGTSGDMEKGTADYADMFYRPMAFGFLPFVNIWDDNTRDQQVGFFHPINWNMEGFYDESGNSNLEGAKKYELAIRKNMEKYGATTEDIQLRMQERPLSPGEAFAVASINAFPVVELNRQIAKVRGNRWQDLKAMPVNLVYDGERVIAEPILNGTVTPITSYRNLPKDKRGCVMIYEPPLGDPIPRGLYKIGYDPVRQDLGTSLAAIIVYKGAYAGSPYHSMIVAEYIGRRESPEDMDRIAEMLAVYYNTQIMHENEVAGVKGYFKRRKKLHLLAAQPDTVISKNIKQSKVARVYGCHMDAQGRLKDAGERYVKEWLLMVVDYDENDDPITVIDRIYSLRLLEELVSYRRGGNYDLVSALFMCMFQVQEEELGKVHGENKKDSKGKQLLEMMDSLYKN